MPGFFDNFPGIYYTLDDPSKLQYKQAVNIFVRTAMLQNVLNVSNLFYQYYIKDGDTPESLAAKYYNDPTTHWIILYTNQILDPYYQWPLNLVELYAQMASNFGSVATAQVTLDHIEKHTNIIITQNYQQNSNVYISTLANNVISVDGFSTFPTANNPIIQLGSNNIVNIGAAQIDTSTQLYWISAYQEYINRNESNRNISVLKVDYVPQVVAQLKQLLSQ